MGIVDDFINKEAKIILEELVDRWVKHEKRVDLINSYNDPLSYSNESMARETSNFCKDIKPLMVDAFKLINIEPPEKS